MLELGLVESISSSVRKEEVKTKANIDWRLEHRKYFNWIWIKHGGFNWIKQGGFNLNTICPCIKKIRKHI
jgi:hypothetical protein